MADSKTVNEEEMTVDDVEKIYYEQLLDEWDKSYINPKNTATERQRLDDLGL